jgi:hypothetical protein
VRDLLRLRLELHFPSTSTVALYRYRGSPLGPSHCVSDEFLSVYDQVPALAMKVAIQPDRDTIWIRNFVRRKLVAIDFCYVDYDLRA